MKNISPTIDLACQLIRQASVTPDDADCQTLIGNRLQALGFELETMQFEDVTNLWAIYGKEGPIFCFAGHTDVVPAGDLALWSSDPFEPTISEGILYGRGAADMKGSLAAMVTACEDFLTHNQNVPLNGRIAFLITSDEEGPAINGTVKVIETLKARGENIEWCLVGEPSSDQQLGDVIKNGRRGSLTGELTVAGIQGHVAYPHLARNPIHQVAPAIAELSNTIWDRGNEFFPATSFQISNFNSGTGVGNVIPAEAAIMFNFRFSTEVTAPELQQRTHAILDKYELDYTLEWTTGGLPFLTSQGKLIDATKHAIKDVTGLDTQLLTTGGTSDGRFIAPTGAQVVELGPSNKSIHKIDEHVRASDLDRLSEVYQQLLYRVLIP